MFNELEVLVHFTDFDGIVDHHFVNFLFIRLFTTVFSVNSTREFMESGK